MRILKMIPVLFAGALAVYLPQAAAQSGATFSATMVESADGKTRQGRIYVTDAGVRTEMGAGDQQRIMIVDKRNRIAWLLNPARREYVEMKGEDAGSAGASPPLPGDANSPCNRAPGLTCNRLAHEAMNGRQSEKWEIVVTQGEQSMKSLVWVDRALGMPVREEMPGGQVRELRDIRLGAQPADLFRVPQGYRRIEMPKQSGQGAGQPPGGRGQPPRRY